METLISKLAFLSSTRFWALVIGGLAIVSQNNFTRDAWLKGIVFVISGFTVVKTIDRASEKMGEAQ